MMPVSMMETGIIIHFESLAPQLGLEMRLKDNPSFG